MPIKRIFITLFLFSALQGIAQFNIETNVVLGGNFSDEAKDLAVNATGTALFIGASTFSSDGDVPGNAGSGDFWILKQNLNGTGIWSHTYGGLGNDDLVSVMPHPDGGALAFGTTRTSHGLFGQLPGLAGGWLVRINNNGTLVDGKIFGGNTTELAVDASRHVGGNITMAMEAGSGVLNGEANNGILDVWIVQVDPALNIQWSALIGGTGTDVPVAMTSDINGNIYVVATSNSNLPGLGDNKGLNDVWVLKFSFSGELLWQKSFGGSEEDRANSVLFHPDGFVYVLAQSSSTDGDFDFNHGLNDIWMIKLDADDGAPLQFVQYGGTGNDFNASLSIYGNDHLVISSASTSNDVNLTGNKGLSDIWIWTTTLDGEITQQMNYGGTLNDFARDIITIDSLFYVLGTTISIDKNVPFNTISQPDLWYFTLNTHPDSCSHQFLCQPDTTLNNQLFPPADDILVCVSGCTAGYGPGPDLNNSQCPDFNNATAYFYVTTDTTADLLTLSVTSNDFNQPHLALLKSVNCTSFQFVDCGTGTNGSVVLQYIDIEPQTTYVIAISDVEGNFGEFELCATSIDVEFCNEQDRIYVTNTSLGSPLSGPFKPGEEVQICYELQDWNKLDCNGFQGLVPSFGPGWDSTWFDDFGQPMHVDEMLIPVEEGYWEWYKIADVRYNISNPINGYEGGQGMPAGWYFTNTGDPPPTNGPDQTTGDINSCLPTPDTWRVCFTLKVVDECESNLDCSVSMKTFADGEIGSNLSLSCAYDQEETFTAYMLCCINPQIEQIQNFSLCSGDTISFRPETNLLPLVTYSWSANPDPFIEGASSGTNASQFYQILSTNAVIPLKVRYSIRGESGGCITSTEDFEITVLPLPTSRISVSGPVIVCSGSTVNLNFESTGNPPFAIDIYRNNAFFANTLSETNFLSIDIDPVFSGTFTVGAVRDANCEGQGFGIVNITVEPVSTTILDTALCEGGSFMVGTSIFTEPGSYIVTLDNGAENNCDSIVAFTLSITPSLTETIDEIICNGDTLFVLDQPYTETTSELIEYPGPLGCPDYINLNLTVLDTFTDAIDQTICDGDTLEFEGILVYQAGTYSHVIEIRPGCFEETLLHLNVLPAIQVNDLEIIGDIGFNNGAIVVEINGGTPPFTFLWDNGETTESLFNIMHGTYTLSVTDQLGCSKSFTFEVPMISGTNGPVKDLIALKTWPSIISAGNKLQLLNTGSDPISIASIEWWTANGQNVMASKEFSLEAGSVYTVLVPINFTDGIYFLKILLESGDVKWSKVVVE